MRARLRPTMRARALERLADEHPPAPGRTNAVRRAASPRGPRTSSWPDAAGEVEAVRRSAVVGAIHRQQLELELAAGDVQGPRAAWEVQQPDHLVELWFAEGLYTT